MIQHLDPIWITGIGAGTPHGWDYSTIVDSLIAGKSGIDTVRTFDISHHPSQMGAASTQYLARPIGLKRTFDNSPGSNDLPCGTSFGPCRTPGIGNNGTVFGWDWFWVMPPSGPGVGKITR